MGLDGPKVRPKCHQGGVLEEARVEMARGLGGPKDLHNHHCLSPCTQCGPYSQSGPPAALAWQRLGVTLPMGGGEEGPYTLGPGVGQRPGLESSIESPPSTVHGPSGESWAPLRPVISDS